jgi:hypothetical protein
MMIWGGPRRPIEGVVGFTVLNGALLCLGGLRPSALLVTAGAFGVLFADQMMRGCSAVIWQRTVPQELQARVFAIRTTAAQAALPLAPLVAGPLADRIFEPALAQGGRLAPTFGRLLGVGPGRGVALLFLILGASTIVAALLAGLHRGLRQVDDSTAPRPVHGEATR